MKSDDYYKKEKAFFESYLEISERLYDSYGYLSSEGFQMCCECLIEKGVFKDFKEIQIYALKEQGIILRER